MGLTFPTGHHTGQHVITGQPLRAQPCGCDPDTLLDPHHNQCIRCGHYPAVIINRTWQQRAETLRNHRIAA